jgi:dUTP pyrophosphatase
MKLKIKYLEGAIFPPRQATKGSAGWDLYCNDHIILRPNEVSFVRLGFCLQIPEDYYVSIVSRSSMAKRGVIIPNSPGIIDSDYTGEIMVMLININPDFSIELSPGERIAQMLLNKQETIDFEVTDTLKSTERGSGGFGSTGK